MFSQILIAPKKVGLLLYYKNILFNYYILKVLIRDNLLWIRRQRHRYQKPSILRLPCKLIWSVLWCLEFDLLICQVDALWLNLLIITLVNVIVVIADLQLVIVLDFLIRIWNRAKRCKWSESTLYVIFMVILFII